MTDRYCRLCKAQAGWHWDCEWVYPKKEIMTTPKKPLANAPERFAEMRDELAEKYAFSSKGNAHDTRRTGFRNGWQACAKAIFESSELKEIFEYFEKIRRRTFVDEAEGPELRNQNAANFRDAIDALDKLDKLKDEINGA